MRLLIVIAGVLVGAVIGLFVDLAISHVYDTYYIALLLTMVAGACLGALIGKFIKSCLAGKKQTLEHLPVSTADFIKLVIKEMRYRKKVRADVMAELTAHFEDGLKDCKTYDEKNKRANQLISEFGDAQLLGTLLRRAKRRCRPLWRTVVARGFQAAGVLVLCLIIYIIWFLTGKPAITTNYVAQLNRIMRPAADENQNAGPLYNKAGRLYGRPSDDFLRFVAENYNETIPGSLSRENKLIIVEINKLLSNDKRADFERERARVGKQLADSLWWLLLMRYRKPTVEQRKLIERWLQDSSEALDLVTAGVQKPYYWQQHEEGGDMMSIDYTDISNFGTLGRALCWRAWLRAEQGRYEDAFGDIKSCYRLGQHLKDKTLAEQLVGISNEVRAVQTLCDILGEHEFDSSALAGLQRHFEQASADEDFTLSLEGEKLFAYDAIQRCFTEDHFGGGHLSRDAIRLFELWTGSADLTELMAKTGNWTALFHVLFAHPNKRESRETVDRLYSFWDKIARKTPAQLRAENIDVDKQKLEIIRGNLLLTIIVPPLDNVNALGHRAKAEVKATITILALLRYNNDEGRYPEVLKELTTSGYLSELPIDPYRDEPHVYKKTDNDFTLYSVGENSVDDGGTRYGLSWEWGKLDKGDRVFWPIETRQQEIERRQKDAERLQKQREEVWRKMRERLGKTVTGQSRPK